LVQALVALAVLVAQDLVAVAVALALVVVLAWRVRGIVTITLHVILQAAPSAAEGVGVVATLTVAQEVQSASSGLVHPDHSLQLEQVMSNNF
jgi:hypothetical protein